MPKNDQLVTYHLRLRKTDKSFLEKRAAGLDRTLADELREAVRRHVDAIKEGKA